MESVSSTGHIRNCYFQVLFKSLQNVVLWAEIAYNQHLSHSDFSLVLKVCAELGDLLLNTVKKKISSFFKVFLTFFLGSSTAELAVV